MPLFDLPPPHSRRARRARRSRSARNHVSQPPSPNKAHRKPVYIYPGLIRMSGNRAVAIDANCPASVYTPSSSSSSSSPSPSSPSRDACSVCLDSFMPQRDIVRRLPCGHFFHSRCILSWICSADRCPLCNEPVLNRSAHRTVVMPAQEHAIDPASHTNAASSSVQPVEQHLPEAPTEPASHAHQLASERRHVDLLKPLFSERPPLTVGIPDVTPSTFCHMQSTHMLLPSQQQQQQQQQQAVCERNDSANDGAACTQRVYSFVLHDRARFSYLLESQH